jgi:serine/threonine protein kinase/tetratricopeptide (TPR) repeat protein
MNPPDDERETTTSAIFGESPDLRIGPYKALKELGRGGMGVVYLGARADEQYQKRVAIKIIKAEVDRDEVVTRFRRERQILASLDHPNIARFLDGGTTEDGRPYFVMEYVEGKPIDSFCDRRALSILARVKLFRSVCSALEYAHRNLIVHRDIKPGNILVTAEGVPKLLDFGIAKLVNPGLSGEAATMTGLAMTPEYASPEQARCEPVTTVSDVYSLGVLLYKLLTGHLPYRFKTRQPLDILRAVCEDAPEKPSTAVGRTEEGGRTLTAEEVSRAREGSPERLRRRLSGDLDTILLMALRKEPSRRYPSVEAFSEDLRRYLEQLPIQARKATFSYRTGKFLARHRAGITGVAVVILLVLGFSVSTVVQSRQLRRERDKASRVSSFLVDLFKVSNPSEARGNTVTAREILDKGAERIRGELKEEPEVRATLMATMGKVYNSLGLFDKAEGLLRDALEIRRRVLGHEHPEVAATMHSLAGVLLAKGDYAGAEALFREALSMRRKLLGNEHPDVASSLVGLADVLDDKGDYAGAEALFREALAMRRRLLGNEHPDVARSLIGLADVLDYKGNYAEAEALFREAIAMERKLLGNEHPHVAASLNSLAIVLYERGDYAGAEALYRESLAMQRKLLGNEHPEVATSLNNLADVLDEKGDYAGAEALYREALAMWRKLLGNEHPHVATSLNNLADVLDEKGDYAGAEAFSREGLALDRKLLGNEHRDVARSLRTLGQVLYHQHRLAEAEKAFRESLEIGRKALPPDHPDIAFPLIGLGNVLVAEGQALQAEAMLRRGLEIRRKTLPKDNPRVAEAESALGACLTRLRKFDEAESLLLDSYHILRSKPSARLSTHDARGQLIDLYITWGRPEKAREYTAIPARAGNQ